MPGLALIGQFVLSYKSWILAGLLALACIWYRHEADAARAELQGVTVQLDTARQDADRWQQASNARDAAIAERDAQIRLANQQVEQLRADAERANTAVQEAIVANNRLKQQAADLQTEIERQAHDHPQDVRAVGPIVAAHIDSLF